MSGITLRHINDLFHFTDRRNVPLIREHGGLLPYAHLRKRKIDIPAPGGNEWSHDADEFSGVDTYVHLCLRNSHPMEHVARKDGRLVDTIFLKIDTAVLQWEGIMFTPDVSNKSGVEMCTLQDAMGLIDYEVLYTYTDWRDPTIQERLSKAERCEVLVPHKIPLDMIRNLPDG